MNQVFSKINSYLVLGVAVVMPRVRVHPRMYDGGVQRIRQNLPPSVNRQPNLLGAEDVPANLGLSLQHLVVGEPFQDDDEVVRGGGDARRALSVAQLPTVVAEVLVLPVEPLRVEVLGDEVV